MEALRYNPRYTVADYEQWSGDWELWRGVAVAMTPSPGGRHQRVAGRLFRQISDSLDANGGCPCEAFYEIDWRIDDETVVRPDISVICSPLETEFITSPPTLIVEVLSPATREKDRTAKRALYAVQSVRFYVLADPESQSVEVLRLVGTQYETVGVNVEGLSLELHRDCEVTLDIDGLWRSDR